MNVKSWSSTYFNIYTQNPLPKTHTHAQMYHHGNKKGEIYIKTRVVKKGGGVGKKKSLQWNDHRNSVTAYEKRVKGGRGAMGVCAPEPSLWLLWALLELSCLKPRASARYSVPNMSCFAGNQPRLSKQAATGHRKKLNTLSLRKAFLSSFSYYPSPSGFRRF